MLGVMSTAIPYPILTLLQRCHELEELMGKTYAALARAHAGHQRVAALWAKTAKEEENHAAQFELAMTFRGDMIKALNVQVLSVERAVEQSRAFLDEAQRGKPSIEESLRRAIALEEQMADFHLHMAVTFDSPQHQKLFKAMMASDRGHVESLRKELERVLSERR